MKVWLVLTGTRETLPFGWNCEETQIIAIYDNEAAALAHKQALLATKPPSWELPSVEVRPVAHAFDQVPA